MSASRAATLSISIPLAARRNRGMGANNWRSSVIVRSRWSIRWAAVPRRDQGRKRRGQAEMVGDLHDVVAEVCGLLDLRLPVRTRAAGKQALITETKRRSSHVISQIFRGLRLPRESRNGTVWPVQNGS